MYRIVCDRCEAFSPVDFVANSSQVVPFFTVILSIEKHTARPGVANAPSASAHLCAPCYEAVQAKLQTLFVRAESDHG